ncbi:MAG: trypsin-like peptidase domain-containing protein [Erysipelotrichaceae bacterium]|nr:PDZ domain-containing protein [Erysipelotrichaceae bacterium]
MITTKNYNDEIIDVYYEETNKKPKKDNKLLHYILIAFISISFGFLGGSIYSKLNPNKEIIYQNIPIVENTVTNNDDLSVQQVVLKVQDSVVQIKVESLITGFLGQTLKNEGAGSGVIISEDGYIVTNNHVIEGVSNIYVTLNNNKEYKATLVGADVKTDLAVIKIEGNDFVSASIGDSSSAIVGDTAIVIGNPLGEFGGTVTTGIISALNRDIIIDNQAMNLLQTNAEVNPGNSGGGLFNSKGELIGIINAKILANNVEGIGFAIPSNDVSIIVEQIINDGYVSDRATLGIYTTDIGLNNKGFEPGLYITEVIKDSGAYKAGLKAYDRIIKFNDIEINSYPELSKELKKFKPNDVVSITVIRDKKELTVDVTLTKVIIE